jgi:hypothetical protein
MLVSRRAFPVAVGLRCLEAGRVACRTLAQKTTPQAACLTSQAVLQSFLMAIHSGVPKAGMFQHDAQARGTTWPIGIP